MSRVNGREKVTALGYIRTSSAANVGADRDSETRQRLSIGRHAALAGVELVGWYNGPPVSRLTPQLARKALMTGRLDEVARPTIARIADQPLGRWRWRG
jgi:hypothetical protein